MKTTLDIPDTLLEEARELARRRGTTLRALVADALRAQLEAQATAQAQGAPPQPLFTGEPGLQDGVDLSDWERIRDVAYGRWGG